jgi:hypothetical protein
VGDGGPQAPIATVSRPRHAQSYEDFRVGDDVYCLAWIGLPFRVVATDDAAQCVSIRGQLPSSFKAGVELDIYRQNLFMLTHELWDHIWYWPDRAGETYTDVFDRFVGAHRQDEIVNGYYAPTLEALGVPTIDREPELAQAFRLDLTRTMSHRQVKANPVCAVDTAAEAIFSAYDPAIADGRWLATGPARPVDIGMKAYRWCLSAGGLILNADDFG